jgi:hypothetical protein
MMHADFSVAGYVLRPELFRALQQATGVRFSAAAAQRLRANSDFLLPAPLTRADLARRPFVPVLRPVTERRDIMTARLLIPVLSLSGCANYVCMGSRWCK